MGIELQCPKCRGIVEVFIPMQTANGLSGMVDPEVKSPCPHCGVNLAKRMYKAQREFLSLGRRKKVMVIAAMFVIAVLCISAARLTGTIVELPVWTSIRNYLDRNATVRFPERNPDGTVTLR